MCQDQDLRHRKIGIAAMVAQDIEGGIPSKGLLAWQCTVCLRGLHNADGEELNIPGIQPCSLKGHLQQTPESGMAPPSLQTLFERTTGCSLACNGSQELLCLLHEDQQGGLICLHPGNRRWR